MVWLSRHMPTSMLASAVQHSGRSTVDSGVLSLIPTECTDPRYSWLSNKRGQSACDVARAVADNCVQTLQDARVPLPRSSCPCNTVLYSLIYACAICADITTLQIQFGNWSSLMVCQDTLAREYPRNLIPSSVVIPAWAYLDLTHDDKFDVASAEEEVAQASSSKSGPPASTRPNTSGTLTTSTALRPGQGSEPSLDSADSTSSSSTNDSATLLKTSVLTTSQSQTSSVANSREASAQMPPPTAASGEASNIQTGTHASAAKSVAVIVGSVIGGLTALALAVCGAVAVVVRSRKGRHRQIGRRTTYDSLTAFREIRGDVRISIQDPASTQDQRPLPELPALQIPQSPQDGPERRVILASPPRVPEIIMDLYDPDDPATYPPPLSVIHCRPMSHSEVFQGWDVPPDYSS
ncbi:hypothetical protein C8Q70DRAFT_481634 [Cubamyces menziesii]|nr:hypothetical protein C8Q70DRAFT_481634 [Cubamyces menziesii]